MKKEKKAVLFDLDGTLLNTLGDLTDAVNYALTSNGFEPRSEEEVMLFTGNGIKNLMQRSTGLEEDDPKFLIAYSAFKDFYLEHCLDKTYPYQGIKETLLELKKRGYEIGVVSNKADYLAIKIINHYFPNTFDFVTGARENMLLKPASDLPMYALKCLNVCTNDAYYVGDTMTDSDTAWNSNLKLINVTYGFRTKEELLCHGAKVFAETPEELLKYLK